MTEFVNVPVPVEYVTKVYALLAGLADSSERAGEESRRPFGGWSEDHLSRLRDCPQASVQKVAGMLDILSKSPGQPIAYTDLANQLGIGRRELQGALSGFTRWIRKEWGDDDGWPMTITYGESRSDDVASEGYYFVTPTTAKRWLAIRQTA